MKIECSNCMGQVTLSFTRGTASVTTKASGRAGKRTEARTTTTPLIDENGLWAWEAPCCPDYWDSYEREDN